MSDDEPEAGTFTYRTARFIDNSFRIDGEMSHQSTVTGDREWIPVAADGDDEIAEELRATMDGISGSGNARKRKSYLSSDNPMLEFKEVQQEYLNELVRLAGLGDAIEEPKCALCQVKLDANALAPVSPVEDHGTGTEEAEAHEEPPDLRIFGCTECGEFIQCKNCCLARHSMTPLHFLKVWEGGYWNRTTLKSLGLIYQLGHGGGPCLTPNMLRCSMVVVDTTGIHQIHYKRCGCARRDHMNPRQELLRNEWFPASATDPDTCATLRVLESFRLLNVIGTLNCHDFVTALERMTSAVGSTKMVKVPDRYKETLRMSRQHSLKNAERSGQAHNAAGLVATKSGATLPTCWGCPYDGWNLAVNWRDVDPKYGYLDRSILALDANFKLKNRIRPNEHEDPPLGPGWGAWVDPARYKEHLKKYIAENDVSTCIAFAALTQKETRNTAGLRVSGVGAAKGERYANMDFIAMSAVSGSTGMELTFFKLPEDLQLSFETILFQTGIPVWHASSHEAACTNLNSLSFLSGVGKTDGEGIERLWAELNVIWAKGISYACKLIVAIAERAKQVAAWKEVNKSIPTEVRAAWQERVDAFLADRTQPNPYLINVKGKSFAILMNGPSEAEIRTALKRDEEEAAARGTTPLHGTSATTFLTAGLKLEDTQRRIKAEISGITLVTADRESKIQESRLAFLAKLRVFRQLQEIYTPGAIRAIEALEHSRNPDTAPVKAENLKLFLPSELSDRDRAACRDGLPEMEAKLREAQCGNSLVALRAHLHAKRHVLYWKAGGNVGGQHGATRANSLVGQITDRIDALAAKYNQARAALLKLKGPNYAPFFKPLKQSDLTLDADVNDDEANGKKRLSLIAAGKGRRTPCHVQGTLRTTLSWIWAARGALDPNESDLHESLRVEWARAKARKTRWDEEVQLLLRRNAASVADVAAGTRAGLVAYAKKQAALHRDLCAFFFTQLNVSLGDATAASVDDEDGSLGTLFDEETDIGLKMGAKGVGEAV
ncbi:hypothetical protein B0H16DRAFT_1728845 [Mycena metata]|uniref:CxC2-like cysteine cluster KDZ transposase-associated domain-containing protein n=1 Tax=Mycena metata TaxID=1033252 RepID=A0AAD7N0Z5_9AGAR|nr:hypothetical protein B0H16DRAFT_1728845 [Mycena metata]